MYWSYNDPSNIKFYFIEIIKVNIHLNTLTFFFIWVSAQSATVMIYFNFKGVSYSKCVFETGNTFTSNSAAVSGGALCTGTTTIQVTVYWSYNDPSNITATPTYSSNIATKYGNDYGSFAQRLITITESQYNNINSSRYCFMHSK